MSISLIFDEVFWNHDPPELWSETINNHDNFTMEQERWLNEYCEGRWRFWGNPIVQGFGFVYLEFDDHSMAMLFKLTFQESPDQFRIVSSKYPVENPDDRPH